MNLGELGNELEDVEAKRKSALHGSTTRGAGVPDTIHEGVEEDTFSDKGTWETVKAKQSPPAEQHVLLPVYCQRTNPRTLLSWRTGKITNASGYTAPRTADLRDYSKYERSNYAGSLVNDGINVVDLLEGVIVWHLDLRECTDKPTTMKEGTKLLESAEGHKALLKGRYFCILKAFERHINEVPLYSYDGNGITKKSEYVKKQHVGVRPPHLPAKEYVKQNEYQPLEVETMKDPNEKLHEMTVLHFVEQRSTSFKTRMRIVGKFTPESITRLRKLRADAGC